MATSGSLAAIFSLLGSKKWIIRAGLSGISSSGSGAPIGERVAKARGLRKVLLLLVGLDSGGRAATPPAGGLPSARPATESTAL